MTSPAHQRLMHEALVGGVAAAGISPEDLWRGYVDVGGSELPGYVEDVLAGRQYLAPAQYDMFVQAIHDQAVALGRGSFVPSFAELAGGG